MQTDPLYNGPSGYVGMLNNPVSTVDPDGREPITIGLAVAISAAVSAVSYTASVALSDGGFNSWDWGQFTQGVTIGAFSGAVTWGIGTGFDQLATVAVEAGKTSKLAIIEAGRIASHATFQGGLSVVQGEDFWTAMASGATGSVVGLGTGGLEGTGGDIASIGSAMLLGGITAEATGGDFWKGAAISGIVAGANHVAHRIGRNLTEKTVGGDGGETEPKEGQDQKDCPCPKDALETAVRKFVPFGKDIFPREGDNSIENQIGVVPDLPIGPSAGKSAVSLVRQARKLSPAKYRAAKSLYRQALEHARKLRKFIKNPEAFDNAGHLSRNANNPKIQRQIIDGRINHLKHEINTFYRNILKLFE